MEKQTVGCPMPMIGLGTHQGASVDAAKLTHSIRCAVEAGIYAIDTGVYYGTEAIIGDALQKLFEEGKLTREKLFMTTKLPCAAHRRDLVVPALKKSLELLKLDYVDLYLIHWPVGFQPPESGDFGAIPTDGMGHAVLDDKVTLEETWKGMEECVNLGLCKHIGFSNFNEKQIERILKCCDVKPVNNQVECSVYFNNLKLVTYCLERNISVTAYSPFRIDFWHEGGPKHSIKEDTVLRALAQKYNKSAHQIALRFLTQNGCSVLSRSHETAHMKANTEIFDFALTENDVKKIIDQCETGKRMLAIRGLIGKASEYPFTEDSIYK